MTPADSAEVTRHLHNLSVIPGWNTTTTKEIATELLKSEWVFCNGYMRDIVVKHLGLGVYRVSSTPRP